MQRSQTRLQQRGITCLIPDAAFRRRGDAQVYAQGVMFAVMLRVYDHGMSCLQSRTRATCVNGTAATLSRCNVQFGEQRIAAAARAALTIRFAAGFGVRTATASEQPADKVTMWL